MSNPPADALTPVAAQSSATASSWHGRQFFITGTDTDVGKSHFCQLFAAWLKATGVNVEYCKPVETGWMDGADDSSPPEPLSELAQAKPKSKPKPKPLLDTERMSAVLGEQHVHCQHQLPGLVAPPRAAKSIDLALPLSGLIRYVQHHESPQSTLLLEGAGGLMSPLADDGLNLDLARVLNYPVILVVANRLGCINHALLSQQVLADAGLELAAVVINHGLNDSNDQSVAYNTKDMRTYLQAPLLHMDEHAYEAEALAQALMQ